MQSKRVRRVVPTHIFTNRTDYKTNYVDDNQILNDWRQQRKSRWTIEVHNQLNFLSKSSGSTIIVAICPSGVIVNDLF